MLREGVLDEIAANERETGIAGLDLPREQEYFIELRLPA
jgi:hypothetical protein